MTKPIKVRKVGTSVGITLSPELLTQLGVMEGDLLYPIRTPTGIELTPYDPAFVEAIESTRDYMRRHRDAMKTLADG